MDALMSSLWPQLRLPGAVLFYWPSLNGCSGPGVVERLNVSIRPWAFS